MRNILLALLLGAFTWSANAQHALQGTITDEADQPLPWVAVGIGDLGYGTTTDERGAFRLDGLRPGPVRLRAVLVGHAAIDTLVDPATTGMLSLRMPQSTHQIRAVEVTALRAGDGSPYATSKVPRDYYGYPHVDLCLTEYCPPSVKPGKMEPLYLCWISQAEAIERLRALEKHSLFPLDMSFSSGSEIRENPVVRGDYQHIDAPAVLRQRQ